VDAEVPDVVVSTAPASGPEAPSFSVPAAVAVPVGSVVVPVLVADSEVPLVPVAPAVPLVPPGPADTVSSAHATPGVVATAIPTPNATANPPTRPMYFAVPIMISSPVGGDADGPSSSTDESLCVLIDHWPVCMARRC